MRGFGRVRTAIGIDFQERRSPVLPTAGIEMQKRESPETDGPVAAKFCHNGHAGKLDHEELRWPYIGSRGDGQELISGLPFPGARLAASTFRGV